jgi:hypothetical protein
MKPYSDKPNTKGQAGRRRSCDTPHRRRCLRSDRKSARQAARIECLSNDKVEPRRGSDVGSDALLDCLCGSPAGAPLFMGLSKGYWEIRCRANCCAMAQGESKAAAIANWNDMQSNGEVSRER